MPKPTAAQKNAFKELQKQDSSCEVRWDKTNGTPSRIRCAIPASRAAGGAAPDPEEVARGFLTDHKKIFGLADEAKDLQLQQTTVDSRGNNHLRFQQTHKNLRVFGTHLNVHLDSVGAVKGTSGSPVPGLRMAVTPKIKAATAKKTALKHDRKNTTGVHDEPELVILPHKGKTWLAWHITLFGEGKALDGSAMPARWEYFIDAKTGKLIWRYNNMQGHGRTTGTGGGNYAGNVNLNTFHSHADSTYQLRDQWMPTATEIVTCDGAATTISADDNNQWDGAAQRPEVDCHVYSRAVYDYYLLVHGRDSYDDAGAEMRIVANYGTNLNNAYWNGSHVLIGNGDGTTSDPYCTLDIVAHEWTHAVTEFTAGLVYNGESGALNESCSDVFAALIDGDWLQGEDNWLGGGAPAGRNLADPTNGGQYDPADPITSVIAGHQPDHTDDQYTGAADNGGVHINSGIMNKAAHLVATGGTHRNITICEALGRDVLGRLYYQALTTYLTPSSDFEDMKDAVLDALDDLYDGDPRHDRWKKSVTNAFAAVGVGDPVSCRPPCFLSPIQCRVQPTVICPPQPTLFCPPLPTVFCPPRPGAICPPSPTVCPRSPLPLCPPSPSHLCPPSPRPLCPPNPTRLCPPLPGGECPPSPSGCLPGPDPVPFNPAVRRRRPPK